ncbi:MAG: hypothetical protein ABIP20_10660 [Chthoniobacteraceae bacterium]
MFKTPASHIDLFPTILDCFGRVGNESNGRSLRPLIEGRETGKDRVAVSEWAGTAVPGFMVCDGRWKLMFGSKRGAVSSVRFTTCRPIRENSTISSATIPTAKNNAPKPSA